MKADQNCAVAANTSDDLQMFELAPVPLLLEDYSELKVLFDAWRREGVTSLHDHLHADPDRIRACLRARRVIKANRKTLRVFGADSTAHLRDSLDRVFRDQMPTVRIDELVQLWDGDLEFGCTTVNYTLANVRLDIQVAGVVLPGYENTWARVLIAIEDITARETASRQAVISQNYAHGLFDHSPISLWVEDFSGVKALIDDARANGIEDFSDYTEAHPDFVERCMAAIQILDVNLHTLEMFGAPDKAELVSRVGEIFRDNMVRHFREQLIDLWEGKLFQQREVVNYALDGTELQVHMQFSVLPGHEKTWTHVQVALTDISARKKAEAYLEYLGKHDALTKLFNRTFYNDELNRLDLNGPHPITIILADVNGLKTANDDLGHSIGDELLRRLGEVLIEAVRAPNYVARIGGDEFAILMPLTEEREGLTLIGDIKSLIEANNHFYPGLPLSLSLGMATSRADERLDSVVNRADARMYEDKQAFYATVKRDRRRDRRVSNRG